MALTQFLLETGPEGANLTNATSGSNASSLAGGTTIFRAAAAAHGNFGGEFINVAAAQTYRRWPFAAVTKQGQFSVVLEYINPGETIDLAGLVNASGARRLVVRIMSTGVIRITAGAGNYDLVTAGTITAGTKFRVAVEFNGGSTTASSIQARVYTETSAGSKLWTNPIGTEVNTSTADMSVDDLVGLEVGVLTNTASSRTVRADDIQVNNGAGSRIPDYAVQLAAPVLTVTPTNATGASDGSVQTSWEAIPGANHYEYALVSGTVTSGFVATDLNAVSPKISTGLAPGTYTVAVRAKAS